MSDDFPSQKLDKIIIRLPDGLRRRIQRSAVANGRSMNAEIVVLLQHAYPEPTKLDEHIQDILDLIAKFPPDERQEMWEAAHRKLDEVRKKSER